MKKTRKSLKRIVLSVLCVFALTGIATALIYNSIDKIGESLTVTVPNTKKADCIIVLGAGVNGSTPSLALSKRLDKAVEVYGMGHTNKIIVSGDHGRKSYDEVNVMRDYLMERGVPRENIFMDHAGFSTYETMYRARDVFEVRSAIVVTQRLHLRRALFIADALGIEVTGVEAENSTLASTKVQQIRELPARVKAFFDCKILHSKPKYLGEVISITGSGTATEGKMLTKHRVM